VILLGSLDAALMGDGEINKQAVHAVTCEDHLRGACEGAGLNLPEVRQHLLPQLNLLESQVMLVREADTLKAFTSVIHGAIWRS
jgi:hypothetical protein